MRKFIKVRKVGSNQYKESFRKLTNSNSETSRVSGLGSPARPRRKSFMDLHWLIKLFIIMAVGFGSIFVLSYIYEHSPEPVIVSPVPEVKMEEIIKVAFASEPKKITKTEAIRYIVQEFSGYGPVVTMQALKIAECESKFDVEAEHWNTNGSVDRGLFQINSVHGYDEWTLFAMGENVKIALKMYERQGWKPWACAYKLGIIK